MRKGLTGWTKNPVFFIDGSPNWTKLDEGGQNLQKSWEVIYELPLHVLLCPRIHQIYLEIFLSEWNDFMTRYNCLRILSYHSYLKSFDQSAVRLKMFFFLIDRKSSTTACPETLLFMYIIQLMLLCCCCCGVLIFF